MAFRIRDIQAIHNNQLNKSVSKQQYSIPKANRFQRCHTVLSDKYYDLPTTNNHKATAFDRAERKTIFAVKGQTPSPGSYNVKNVNIEVKNIIIPHGREECKVDGFLEQKDKTPGPGAYSPNPQVNFRSTSKFSFSASSNNQPNRKDETPGPGAYPLRSTWLEKEKILSTEKKFGCTLIRDGNAKRVLRNGEALDTPYYYPKHARNGKETFNITGGFSIGKSLRFKQRPKTQTELPGPGTYTQFSEFI